MRKNYDQERSSCKNNERPKIFYNRVDFSEDKAKEMLSKYPGLQRTVYNRFVSHYKNSDDSLPVDTLNFLMDLLPAYYDTYDECINFINTHANLLFINYKILEAKLACLHILELEQDALENCQSLIIRSKTRNLYSICCSVEEDQGTFEHDNLNAEGVRQLMDKIIENGYIDTFNNRYSADSQSFNDVRLNYRNFIYKKKDASFSLK
ncbi:MAG: hypothetical protein RSG51_02125 [Bacilli bacterium]